MTIAACSHLAGFVELPVFASTTVIERIVFVCFLHGALAFKKVGLTHIMEPSHSNGQAVNRLLYGERR